VGKKRKIRAITPFKVIEIGTSKARMRLARPRLHSMQRGKHYNHLC